MESGKFMGLRQVALRQPLADVASLYQEQREKVFAVCLRMTGNRDVAEDLTQDTFVQVVRKAHTFRGESRPSTWLYRLAINVVLLYLRPKLNNALNDQKRNAGAELLECQLAHKLTDSLSHVDLQRAISQLPDGCRQVFLLHEVHGYTHHEMSGRFHSVGNCKSQLHKAKRKLRKLLKGSGGTTKLV
jgi:RNA polymerase sigma-70 factor, ECF subfamily